MPLVRPGGLIVRHTTGWPVKRLTPVVARPVPAVMVAIVRGVPNRVVPDPGIRAVVGESEIAVHVGINRRGFSIIDPVTPVFDGIAASGSGGKQNRKQYGVQTFHDIIKNTTAAIITC